MIERDFYWINPQSVVIPKGKLQEKIKKEKHQKMKSFAQWQQLTGMWRQVARYLPGMPADKVNCLQRQRNTKT